MAIRTISYVVTVDGISPSARQFAGTQGDHNVVELDFLLHQSLLEAINQSVGDDEVVYRFDAYDGSGGKISTEPQNLEGSSCRYLIPEWQTRYGGNIQVYLVISRVSDITEMELYSFPAVLGLKDKPEGHTTDKDSYESISTLYKATKENAEKVEEALKDAESFKDDLLDEIPDVRVSEVDNGVEIKVTQSGQTTVSTVYNGKDGKDGTDGKDGANGKDGVDGVVDYSLVANALKGFASGSVIGLKDVSPLEHTVKVKTGIGGGEVLTKTEVLAAKGDSVLLNNPSKSVRIVMIGGAYCVGGVIPLVDGDDLTQLGDFTDIAIVPQGSYGEVHGIRDITYRIEGNTLKWEGFGGVWYQNEVSERFDISGEYTLNSSECNIIGFYQVYALDESNPNYQTPQYDHLDIEVSVYEGEGATVKVCGKNLLNHNKHNTTETKSGITFTGNADGSITVNGTATANIAFYLMSTTEANSFVENLKGKSCVLSGCPSGGNVSSSYFLRAQFKNAEGKVITTLNDIGNSAKGSISSEAQGVSIYIYIYKDITIDNLTFYPQVEVGETQTDYEPYKEPVTYTADANGEINIPSQYPAMTIIPDLDVELSVEYNRDINKAFAELTSAIISMGGNL